MFALIKTIKKPDHTILGGVLLVLISVVIAITSFSKSANAAFGVADNHGYFTGQNTHGSRIKVFQNGVAATDAAAFISEIKGHLNFPNIPNPEREDDRQRTGAQFIIHTMLGHDGPRGRVVSSAELADWEARVNSLANGTNGSVDWTGARFISCGESNTAYDPGLDDVTPTTTVHPSGCPGNIPVIRFYDSVGNKVYEIKRDCGNPLGDLAGLPPPPPPPSSNPYTIQGFRTYGGGSGTAFPNGVGRTTVDVTPFSANPYIIGGQSGAHTVTADVTISYNGVTYNRVGYTLCTNSTGCHNGPRNGGGSVNLPGMNGGYYDLWWHYEPVVVVSCAGLSSSPSLPESNQNFTITARFNIGGIDASTSITARIRATGLVVSGNPKTEARGSSNPREFTFTAKAPSGVYSGTYELTTSAGTLYCAFGNNPKCPPGAPGCTPCPPPANSCIPCPPVGCGPDTEVVDKPYFQSRGGDVVAGSGVGDTGCSAIPGQQLIGFNQDISPGYAGSGTSHATFATGSIQYFVSAALNVSLSTRPRALAFANASGYGGSFGGAGNCRPTYSQNLPALTPSPGSTNLQSIGPDNVRYSSGLTINTSVVPPGRRQAVFVESGDVYIAGNGITFAGGGTWANQASIPSFYLVVRNGNIYISPSVSQLDGVYIAQGSGVIYTCASGASVPSANYVSSRRCNTTLTVNGAFIAGALKLLRTAGSLSSSGPAELFNFGPELWLARPPDSITTGSLLPYQSITSLPPIL
jgi:hypothetical protein